MGAKIDGKGFASWNWNKDLDPEFLEVNKAYVDAWGEHFETLGRLVAVCLEKRDLFGLWWLMNAAEIFIALVKPKYEALRAELKDRLDK